LDELNVDLDDLKDLARTLALPKVIGVRQAFSGDVTTLYQKAVRALAIAAASSGEKRSLLLSCAQAYVATMIEESAEANSHKAGRGMWSIENYQPFLLLGRAQLEAKVDGLTLTKVSSSTCERALSTQ
jgi:hypothetical protein